MNFRQFVSLRRVYRPVFIKLAKGILVSLQFVFHRQICVSRVMEGGEALCSVFAFLLPALRTCRQKRYAASPYPDISHTHFRIY